MNAPDPDATPVPPLPGALHELLDHRQDPLEDHRFVAWLLDHPEALQPFAALRAQLLAIGAGPRHVGPPLPPPAAPRAPRPWLLLGAAGAALLAGAVQLLWSAFAAPAAAPATRLVRPDFAPPASLLHFAVVTTVSGVDAALPTTFSAVLKAGRQTTWRTARITAQPPPSAVVPLCLATRTEHENLKP